MITYENRKVNTLGVYCFLNTVNKKRYIGSSQNMAQRLSIHRSQLRGNYHGNTHLQNAWNKYTETNFEIVILEFVDLLDNLIPREQFWLDHFESYKQEFGYNATPIAGRTIMTDEIKKKLSLSHLGIPMKESAKRKLSKTRRERIKSGDIIITEETRKKIGEATRKRPPWKHTEETKKKISLTKQKNKKPAWNKGLKLTSEQKRSYKKIKRLKDPKTGQFIKRSN